MRATSRGARWLSAWPAFALFAAIFSTSLEAKAPTFRLAGLGISVNGPHPHDLPKPRRRVESAPERSEPLDVVSSAFLDGDEPRDADPRSGSGLALPPPTRPATSLVGRSAGLPPSRRRPPLRC